MGILQVDQNIIALNSLDYIKKLESTEPLGEETTSPVTPVDVAPQEEIALTQIQLQRAELFTQSHSNGMKARGLHNIKTVRNALHKIDKLLKKTAKTLRKFAESDFDAKDIKKFNNKIDKIINKFNHILAKSNFDLSDIQNQPPDEIGEIAETIANDLSPSADLPVNGGEVPSTTENPGIITELENVEIPIEIPETEMAVPETLESEIITIPDSEIESLPIDSAVSTEDTLANVNTTIDSIGNMMIGFSYSQLQIESSIAYLILPGESSDTNSVDTVSTDNQSSYTQMQISLESTITQILSNAGESILAQTTNLTISQARLLF